MSVQLPRATMDKLTHDSPEIRLRTLEQIEAKLMRAIAHNETIIDFRAGDLCKQLIRWFGCQPLQSPAKVLTLLSSILRSQYGSGAIERLGAQRFQREIGKVELLLRKRTTELPLVAEIQQLLQQHVTADATARSSSGDDVDDVVEIIATLNLNNASPEDQVQRQQQRGFQYTDSECEVPWSRPSVIDFNSMKFLADILVNPFASAVELQNALQHLQITMCDYPAEYLLQAPNIFGNLLAVFERAEQLALPLADITNTLLVFLKSLQQRLTTRRQCLAFAAPQNLSQVPSRTQLKVSRALELLLTKSAAHLQHQNRDLRTETTQIVQVFSAALEIYRRQELCVPRSILQKLASIAEKRRLACDQQEHFTLQRIEFLHITFLLQNMAENNALRAPLLDADALTPLLADYTLQACFPQRYAHLKTLLCEADYTLNEKFAHLHKLEQSFAAALALLLKSPQPKQSLKSAVALIMRGADICATLEKLRSVRLLELLFDAITSCNPLYATQPELRAQACQLLLQLLRLAHAPLKAYIYQQLAQTMKRHFACLMNAECFVVGVPNAHLLATQIIGVPLTAELLLHLTQEGAAAGAHADVKRHCDDILALLLKSKHLLGDTHWLGLLELLTPVLPLLQCHCTQAPQLLPLLMQLFDPDAFNLPFLTVLQGNIRFLFDGENAAVRSEALTRLIFMLHALPHAAQYLPNIMEISDLIPNDLLLLSAPRDPARIFAGSEAFADAVTLRNLIALLETRDIEPLIRKTTLMQLNVMCQSWSMTGALCADAAYFFAMQALENSMQRDAFADYADAAIPAVGLLAKALLYDAEMRQELASTPNIYILLLRALFHYQNDIQVRQDACICLCQLLFVGYLVVPGGDGSRVELPRICANLQLPLKCEFVDFQRATVAADTALSSTSIFDDAAAESRYLRHFIAASCCGGTLAQITRPYLAAQQQLDFAPELQLTVHDLRLCRATQPAHNLRRFLRAAQNATDAQTLINACITLKLQLLLLAQLEAPFAGNATSAIPSDLSADLYAQLGKYLQRPPGNEADLALFEQLLELFDLCLLLPLSLVAALLAKSLQNDFQHALISLLKNTEIPLRLYHNLCRLLAHLLSAPLRIKAFGASAAASNIFYSNLFDLCADIAMQLFAQRDLQRVRCLLALLLPLASCPLDMPDKLLLYYCKRFLSLSLSLKSFTQTGAQWQRDCLQIICCLGAQMQSPGATFKLPPSSVKYVSGLCGHNDAQVRALAWCVLAHVARFRPPNEANEPTGAQTLVNELAYLPGGCLACCLSTLLDGAEVVLVRQLAGQLFVELLTADDVVTFDDAAALLAQHAFFRHVNEALSYCRLTARLPIHFDMASNCETASETTSFSTCELISCYTRIAIKMIALESCFLVELAEKPFAFKLYELLKQPPEHCNPAYFAMCADICQLYAMFYPHNFVFLQRTLCRDQVWLASFCALLSQSAVAADAALVSVLQLLLALAKDDAAYTQICAQLAKAPAANLVKLFARAFSIANLNTPLQRCSMAVLCLMLIKSQAALQNNDNDAELKSFVDILESPVEIGLFAAVNANAGDSTLDSTSPSKNKENSRNAANKSLKKLPKAHATNTTPPKALDVATLAQCSADATSSLAAYIFIELLRLFTHLNSTKSCKFESAPSTSKIQITESLAVLLKLSPHALAAASNLKLFDKLLRIFNTFLEEFNTSCSTFVRRYGESKKLVIVRNLQLLFQLLLHWFSAPAALLADERQAFELTKVLIQLWPWLAHSGELKLLVLQLCAHLSERSLLVCTQFSTLVASYAHSVLQLVLKIVQFETTKVKAASSEQFPVIAVGLRLVMNCCACAEGRLALVKSHTLDIFDGLHPFNPKSPKIKLEILQSWLEFWELFSRYPEGAQARNLNSLCAVINRTAAPCSATRLLSLRVLRNMCFLPANRSTLMNSTDFMYTVSEVLAQPMDTEAQVSYEEQLLVSVAIWKLISGGAKFVAQIRGTKLAKQLRMLREQLTALEEEEEATAPDAGRLKQLPFAGDLANVLDIIFGIFHQQ